MNKKIPPKINVDKLIQEHSFYFVILAGMVQRLSKEKFKPDAIENVPVCLDSILRERNQLILELKKCRDSLQAVANYHSRLSYERTLPEYEAMHAKVIEALEYKTP